ncbi:MAG: anaerobic glycerol-3-phosphate dehydrogenase subunit C [Planctomycetes bacterium]|nr:anaerobic glycerol-3-phosphate dehydrogenase subunit C [Planctomycetota bacterium]
MDPQRARIQEDLRGVLAGDVQCDELLLQLYATDASIYQITPLAVICPRSTKDVVTCVQYAAENHLPLIARGAGTGLAGESLGEGLVLDFSRYMTRVLEIGENTVRVQPGVIHAHLNRQLARRGRQFGPDPAMSTVTTMGSVAAIDGSGSHWLRYGSARRHIEQLQIVLSDGTLMDVGRQEQARADDALMRRRDLLLDLGQLFYRAADLIDQHQPYSRVNRCGYQLQGVLSDGHFDLPRLLVGSEGTLALFTEITVATQPLPGSRGVCLLLFESLDAAARAVMEILPLNPAACDILDRRHLSLARENDVRFDLLIPPETEAMLLVEVDGDNLVEVRERISQIIARVHTELRLALGSRQAMDLEEVELYWQLARKVVPTLYRLKGSARAIPFVEDMAVPPEMLPEFFSRMLNVLRRHQVTASLFGHAGHGQLHLRPFLDLADRADLDRMQRLSEDLYAEVIELGGTISGEHGDGLSRTSFVARQYGPLYDVFREVKRIFDPTGMLNPGKKIGDDPNLLTKHLRSDGLARSDVDSRVAVGEPGASAAGGGAEIGVSADSSAGIRLSDRLEGSDAAPKETSAALSAAPAIPQREMLGTVELQLNWTRQEMAEVAVNCNGCGACRSQLPEVRMCPIFRLGPREEASPRAKANLIRGILSGALPPSTVTRDDFKQVADLCVNCHQCRLECPANVDIPHLMTEAKAAYVAVNGLRPSDWLMARLDRLSALGCGVSWLANRAIANRQARWLLEKMIGIAQGRKLPRFARQTFLRRATRRRLTRPGGRGGLRVVLFLDIYANYHDTRLAQALVDVLEHNGVSVYVPTSQVQSGMTMISMGVIDRARKLATRNVRILAEAIRQGYHVVTTEPAAASCLVHEYPAILEDDDAKLVANNTSEACTYLWRMHQSGRLLLDMKPINGTLAYHMPCHLRSLDVGSPGENLLRLIPGLTVTRVEKGCSGMAGTYGLKREHYRASLRAGFELISALRDPKFQAGTTECSSCKMQMEQGTTKPTIHPIKLLAQAYGLWNSEESLLGLRGRDLVMT